MIPFQSAAKHFYQTHRTNERVCRGIVPVSAALLRKWFCEQRQWPPPLNNTERQPRAMLSVTPKMEGVRRRSGVYPEQGLSDPSLCLWEVPFNFIWYQESSVVLGLAKGLNNTNVLSFYTNQTVLCEEKHLYPDMLLRQCSEVLIFWGTKLPISSTSKAPGAVSKSWVKDFCWAWAQRCWK